MRTDKQLTADLRRYLKTLKAFDMADHLAKFPAVTLRKGDKRQPLVIGGPRGNNTHCPTAEGDAGQLHEPVNPANPSDGLMARQAAYHSARGEGR